MDKARVAVFVDGSNLFYLQRDQLRWYVDLEKLLFHIEEEYGEIVDAYFYVSQSAPPEAKQQGFLDTIPSMGYSLYTKPLKEIRDDDGAIKHKANLDIEIVLDMFNTIDNYDLAVLVSGDGDFDRALQLLRARGKRFIVMSTRGCVARELRNTAGRHYVDFNSLKDYLCRKEFGTDV